MLRVARKRGENEIKAGEAIGTRIRLPDSRLSGPLFFGNFREADVFFVWVGTSGLLLLFFFY